MCGIAGFSKVSNLNLEESQPILQKMCDAIRHRGPDDSGYYCNDDIALGFRRLSIIDLAGGHQPLFNEDRTIAVVFNGEIYNFQEIRAKLLTQGHRFSTLSDTEVLVHLYEETGEACVRELQGMFAFVLWDSRNKKLLAARDRMGKKPFYYTLAHGAFLFASELKSLMQHPDVVKRLSLSALTRYLAFEYVPTPATILENIYKLEAAHYLIWQHGKLTITPYWQHEVCGNEQLSEQECGEQLESLLREAVRRRLMSDVPLGVFLSGGIDSSSVVAMMAELLPPEQIKTFSIGFCESSFDESSYARTVAHHFHTSHYEKILSCQTLLELLPTVIPVLDEPLGDASIIPTYLLAQFTRQHVTVALGGDGGDELLAGYPTFQAHRFAEMYTQLPSCLRHFVVEPLARHLPVSTRNFSLDFKIKKFLEGVQSDPYVRQQMWLGSFTPEELRQLLRPEVQPCCEIAEVYSPLTRHLEHLTSGTPLEKILYLYTKLYLQDDILVKVDRATMANSLEARAPFLDTAVVEFIDQIPLKYKLNGFTTKYLLKKILKKRLPAGIVGRPKKGFGIPVAAWLKKDLRPLLLQLLARDKLERERIFQYPYVNRLMEEHFQGKKDNRKKLWTLLAFEMWLGHYGQDSLPL